MIHQTAAQAKEKRSRLETASFCLLHRAFPSGDNRYEKGMAKAAIGKGRGGGDR